MRLQSLPYVFVVVCLLSAPAFCADTPTPPVEGPRQVEDVYKILLDRGIPFDADKTRKVTVESLVKAVDPGSVLYNAEEFHKALMEKSVEKIEEWAEGICYMKLKGIYRDCADEVINRIRNWKESGKAGVILDLRSAAGESLVSVDKIAGLYVTGDPLLYQLMDSRGGAVESHRLKVDSQLLGGNMPLMVIVNETTAEASELLAFLLKNRPGVLLIGTRTKGDASVRENIQLSQDEVLHIASKRIVVNGTQFDLVGVRPDITINALAGKDAQKLPEKGITVKPESDKAKVDRKLMERVYPDPVLLRTTDILLGLKAVVSYGSEQATSTNAPAGAR